MSLPDLEWQLVYGRVAWAIVAATLLACLWPAASARPWRTTAMLSAAAILMALPGELSPAYWLGMAFHYPSVLLLACCALKLKERSEGSAVRAFVPRVLMAALAMGGVILYIDAAGLTSLGLYQAGFGPAAAPALALLGVALCAAAVWRGRGGSTPVLMLVALLAYTLLRLPTGNLWDVLLDPLLWAWCTTCLALASVRALLQAYRKRAHAAPSGELLPELPALQPAVAKHYMDNEEHVSVNQ